MATQSVNSSLRKAYNDFSGGLNNHSSSILLRQNEFQTLENFLVNETGLLEKCNGYTKDGSPFTNNSSHFLSMLVNYKNGATVDKLVMAAVDTANSNSNYKVDLKETSGDGTYSYIGHTTGTASFTNGNTAVSGAGTAWSSHLKAGDKIKASAHADSVYAEIATVNSDTSLTLTATYTGATVAGTAYKARILFHKDYLLQGKVFNNKLVMVNGSEKMCTYDNATVDNITDTDAPRPQFIEIHKSRVFVAKTSSFPSRLFWSAVDNVTSWSAAAIEDIFPQDNGNICAIKSFADSLIVFKDNGNIYQVMGSFDQDATGAPAFIRKIDVPDNIGIVAGQTPVVHDDGSLYFLTETGVYALDRRMEIAKTSWNIQGSIDNTSFSVGTASQKTHVWDTAAQFNAGTHSGTRVTNGLLESIFDQYTISSAHKHDGACSVAIDSSNTIHVVYVDSSLNNVIKYSKWTSDGTQTSETVYTHASRNIKEVSMDVSASGLVGVMFNNYIAGSTTTAEAGLYFIERSVGGTWGSLDTTFNHANGNATITFSFKYRSDNVGRAATLHTSNSGTTYNLNLLKRSGTTWSETLMANDAASLGASRLMLNLNASDYIRISFVNSATAMYTHYSNDDGATQASYSVATTAIPAFSEVQVNDNGLSDIITAYSDNGTIKKRNHTAATNTTLDSSGDKLLWYTINSDRQAWLQTSSTGTEKLNFETSYTTGTASFTNGSATVTGTGTAWLTNLSVGSVIKRSTQADSVYGTVLTVDTDTQVTLSATYTGATSSGTYIAKTSYGVTNATTATADTSILPSQRCGVTNGTVYAFAYFGANASEIIVRRIAPYAIWTGDEKSDSTLSAWGTYVVGSQTTNGNTVTHFVALNTASPATVYNTITSGTVISTDATKIYAIPRFRVLMSAWASSSIDSIIMNYTGSGIDARRAVSIVFNNQLYIAHSESGASANGHVFILDINRAWTTTTHPVSIFCRYKNKLYAGNSGNGDLNILLQSKLFNASAYTATATTKQDFLGSLEREKNIYKIYVLYNKQDTGSFTFSYRINYYKDDTSAWVDTTVDQTSGGLAEIVVREGKCDSIEFKISNSGSDQTVEVIGWVILYGFLHTR